MSKGSPQQSIFAEIKKTRKQIENGLLLPESEKVQAGLTAQLKAIKQDYSNILVEMYALFKNSEQVTPEKLAALTKNIAAFFKKVEALGASSESPEIKAVMGELKNKLKASEQMKAIQEYGRKSAKLFAAMEFKPTKDKVDQQKGKGGVGIGTQAAYTVGFAVLTSAAIYGTAYLLDTLGFNGLWWTEPARTGMQQFLRYAVLPSPDRLEQLVTSSPVTPLLSAGVGVAGGQVKKMMSNKSDVEQMAKLEKELGSISEALLLIDPTRSTNKGESGLDQRQLEKQVTKLQGVIKNTAKLINVDVEKAQEKLKKKYP